MNMRSSRTMLVLAVITLLCAVLFMTVNARGSWSFILPFRGTKLATLALVGYAIAVSTVLFQTISNNRILTPAIMGFDALYILIQTVIVFVLGSAQFVQGDKNVLFCLELFIMAGFAGLLFRGLFSGGAHSLHLLLLVGIIFGVLFRSLANLLQRMIDPTDFVVLQDRFFASFNITDTSLLALSIVIIACASIVIWRILPVLDVLALGREAAINLGVNHKQMVTLVLCLMTVLVSVSTALVGPVTFLGLLVANLAYHLSHSNKHRIVLPVASLLAIILLVGGQVILEQFFSFNTALSIIIEFIGGVFFIGLLIKGTSR